MLGLMNLNDRSVKTYNTLLKSHRHVLFQFYPFSTGFQATVRVFNTIRV